MGTQTNTLKKQTKQAGDSTEVAYRKKRLSVIARNEAMTEEEKKQARIEGQRKARRKLRWKQLREMRLNRNN